VEFGTGELVGKINADHLYVAGVQVDHQPFAEITHEIGSIFAEVYYSCNFNSSLDLMEL
jgi:hypothetical protein